MPSGNEGVVISDGLCGLVLHPARSFVPLEHRVDLVAGPFRGSIDAVAYENPFPGFRRKLIRFYETLSGEVGLGSCYGNFSMTMKSDRLGHIAVEVLAIADHVRGIKLTFRIDLDQTHLPPIIKAIDETFIQAPGSP